MITTNKSAWVKAGTAVNASSAAYAAEQAGLKAGDLIITFNGRSIKDWIDLRNRIAETKAGEEVIVTLERKGIVVELPVKIEEEVNH